MNRTNNAPTCPQCGNIIAGDDINVANDVAYCRVCNLAHKFAALMRSADLTEGVDINRPPRGVKYETTGERLTLRISHRSVGAAFGTLAIALFWNGIVSVFVTIAIVSTLSHLDITPPHWFPAPEMNGKPMSVGMTLFLWMFLTPFIAIGLGMIGAFLLTVIGKTEVQIDRNEGSVFTGVGPFGYRRRFLTSQVSSVRIDEARWTSNSGNSQEKIFVVIETREGKSVRFGSMLTGERKKFAAAILYKALTK